MLSARVAAADVPHVRCLRCGCFPTLCHGDSEVAGVKGETSDGRKLRRGSFSQANS